MSTQTQQDRLLSSRDAARRLGVSIPTLHNWRKRGVGPRVIKLSDGLYKWPESEIERMLQPLEMAGEG